MDAGNYRAAGDSQSQTGAESQGAKRKADDNQGHSGNSRSKRNRYVSVACNQCKRRKIRCNGETPCQRCGNLQLECIYASNSNNSEEFQQMKNHIANLQQQVQTLAVMGGYQQAGDQSIDAYADGTYGRPHSSGQLLSPTQSRRYPAFHGPSSSAYGLDVAKSSLQSMGIAAEAGMDDDRLTGEGIPLGQPPPLSGYIHPKKDPLWTMKREDASRLVRLFDEEIAVMYPLMDTEGVLGRVDLLWKFIEAAIRNGFGQPSLPGADALDDDDTSILKMVLAVALVLENNGQSEQGHKLFESVRPTFEAKTWANPDMKGLTLTVLMAMYFFHCLDEAQAWRLNGAAARMCLQLGLHRRDSLIKLFPNEPEFHSVVRTFWTVYSLDRRWSLGTGLPFIFHDDDLDPMLPEPDESSPHLKCMVRYGRIASKFWYFGLNYDGKSENKKEEMNYLDFQILQWYKTIPEKLSFDPSNIRLDAQAGSRSDHRLRLILYLRLNLARLQIHRPVLYSATSISQNRPAVKTAVDVAKDTIRVLTRVNQISDMYRTQQIAYNFFLVQALAVLLLAVCHAPQDYGRQVRDEFYHAIDLVKNFSTNSYVAQRLWKTIRGLREIGEKLGLQTHIANGETSVATTDNAHSDAAVAMAGLAGHPIEHLAAYNNNATGTGTTAANAKGMLGTVPMNGQQMSNELTSLFEFVGNYPSWGMTPQGEKMSGYVSGQGQWANVGGIPAAYGNEEEFSRVMGEIF